MSDRSDEAVRSFNARRLATVDRIRRDARLTPSTRMIGAEIFTLVDFRSGVAWPSVDHLAEKLGLTDRTVKRATAALKAAGYLRVVKAGRNNLYHPVFEPAEQGTICPPSGTQKGTNCPPFEEQKGTDCPPSEADRGQKEPEQGTKTTENRGQKRPPISLEEFLRTSGETAAGRAGAGGEGADAPASDNLAGFGAPLRARLGSDTFASWFAKVAFVSEQGDTVTLAAPARFIASKVKNFYGAEVLDVWQAYRPHIRRLEVIVAAAAAGPAPAPAASAATTVPELAARRRGMSGDARWLVEEGIPMVADRLGVGAHAADRAVTAWLKRCGRDAAGLRRILTEASAHQLIGKEFSNLVKQRTLSLLRGAQGSLKFGPEAVLKRRSER